ncbi:hypothetical protein D3C80_1273780 [compost metagenome]
MTSKKLPMSPFVDFIHEQYQIEAENEHREAMYRTVTLNFSAEDACMLAAIAKRFGKSTAAFGGDVYAGTVHQLFVGLSQEDRESLAVEADAEYVRYAESKGVTVRWVGDDQRGYWGRNADLCQRVEAEQEANDE